MDDQVPDPVAAADRGSIARILFELRQWHVFRVAATYGVVAWLLVQVVATVGPAFDSPAWVLRAVVLAAIIGFLVTMAFLLFRPRSTGKGRLPIYLSPRARLIAGGGVLLIAAVAAALSIRSLRAPEEVALAVLPFSDLSPGRDKAYFSEGVAEEILSSLAAEKGIKVLGRTSARQLERGSDPKAIRASLGITHLLEGSTRTDGNDLRVNVRLIDTSDGSQLWEEEYHGRMADIFSVQDQIAGTVVKRVRGTFFGGTEASQQTGIDAYETYLAARALMRERKEEPLTKALELAKKVIAADPKYAPGHAIYAELLYLLSDDAASYGSLPLETVRPMAVRHAREAVRLAPDKAEGYAALGLILRGEQGVQALQRAIAFDPARAELRIWLGIALNSLGRHDEAHTQILEAAETEPLWPVAINRQVQALSASGQIQEAVAAVNKFRQRGGSKGQALRFMTTIARAKGDISGTIAAGRAQIAADPNLPNQAEALARDYALLGFTKEALELFPPQNIYDRLAASGRAEEVRRKVIADGAKAWDEQATDIGMFALGAHHDWIPLARLYLSRPPSYADFCNSVPAFAPLFILALRNAGKTKEARDLFACVDRRTNLELRMKFRPPAAWPGRIQYTKASLLAVANDRRALDWLNAAVDRGWLGQYFSTRLSDYPVFDAFRSDSRYAAIQKRIDTRIARERAEVLAGR